MSGPTPSKRIIVNADDIGFSHALTDSIIDCHVDGIITSSTLMANMPAAEYAATLAAKHPSLGIGVHVNLTEGEPVAGAEAVPELLGDDGLFPGNAAQTRRLWRAPQLYGAVHREITAQIGKVVDLGIQPTHCDSHHGILKMPIARQALIDVMRHFGIERARTTLSWHRLVPGSRSPAAFAEWTKKFGRRAPKIALHLWSHYRLNTQGIRTPRWKATRDMGVPATGSPSDQFIATLRAAPRHQVSEVLLHPGSAGPGESHSASRLRSWAEDTAVCRDPAVREFITANGIELISFREL